MPWASASAACGAGSLAACAGRRLPVTIPARCPVVPWPGGSSGLRFFGVPYRPPCGVGAGRNPARLPAPVIFVCVPAWLCRWRPCSPHGGKSTGRRYDFRQKGRQFHFFFVSLQTLSPLRPIKVWAQRRKCKNTAQMHKAGFVNIVGNPNVGKSTLMNQLVGEDRKSVV